MKSDVHVVVVPAVIVSSNNNESNHNSQHNYPTKLTAVKSLQIPRRNQRSDTRPRQGGITVTFPMKLHAMLREMDTDTSNVISWNQEGNAFVIQKPKDFTSILLPKYFRTKKFSSFQRQLNAYGFVRGNLYAGQEDMHIYHHDVFHRDHADRLQSIKRRGSGTMEPACRRTFSRENATTLTTTTAAAAVVPDTTISTPPSLASTFDFDVMMADLASDDLEEQQQLHQVLQTPQQQQQVLQQLQHQLQVQQQPQLQQQVLQQEQLQQHFNASFNPQNTFPDSVLDEACAAVTSLEDARSLYAGMLHNWNPEEERLSYWSDASSST